MELFNFIKKEPLGFDGSMNFYSYCEGDPVNFVDVSGLNFEGDTSSVILQSLSIPVVYKYSNYLKSSILFNKIPLLISFKIALFGDFIVTYGLVAYEMFFNGKSFYQVFAEINTLTVSFGRVVGELTNIGVCFILKKYSESKLEIYDFGNFISEYIYDSFNSRSNIIYENNININLLKHLYGKSWRINYSKLRGWVR